MNVLGLNSVYHESSAAVIVDGRVVAAVEEERFNRRKHGKSARVDNPDELPLASIKYCLESAGLNPGDVDAVGYSFDPAKRRKEFHLDPLSEAGDWGSAGGEARFLAALDNVPMRLSESLGEELADRFRWVSHHMAHAASAFYPSEVGDAAVLVVDGIGEAGTGLLAAGEGTTLRALEELQYPHSIGFVWEKFSKYLGFSEYDACKVMGLAGYGNAVRFLPAFRDLVDSDGEGFQVRADRLEFRVDGFDHLEACLGARRVPGAAIEQRHADIAATLQHWNDQVMLMLAAKAFDLHPADTLCLAGGVALNCTTNSLINRKGPFSQIYIPPVPHDAGTAIGAALYIAATDMGGRPNGSVMPQAFTGPSYIESDIAAALARHHLPSRKCGDIAAEAAKLLAAGKTVAWFQGRMEFGPRALGNRSLLADPRDPQMRNRLNASVKHRESFRPFAASILAEDSQAWFDLGPQSAGHEYMLFACPIRADLASHVPAVMHIDGTSRIQVVTAQGNPRYHALISHFQQLSGVPLVLNTSFNDSEPIVCSPDDAIATYTRSTIDALAIGDHLVVR